MNYISNVAASQLILPESYKQDFTIKERPGPLGEAFGGGSYGGNNLDKLLYFMQMPGGGMLLFDLSKLTLQDYRQMRDHYQVTISLWILEFMLNQIDWTIECSRGDIRSKVEANLREHWPRLMHSMATAFWAGFSPNILQYDNNTSQDELPAVKLDKIKDLLPEFTEVNWKQVPGYNPQGPDTSAPKIDIFDGMKLRGQSFPVDVTHSFWYPLLMENGNYYGRKLLRPAFPAYFFSQLLHLFANRYFERYGEPVPIGRFPEEDTIVQEDGVSLSARQVMENVLRNLRNRAVVTLPSTRDQNFLDRTGGANAFEWDIEYLECCDTETEILTRRGWKRYDEVAAGDETLTLDHDTGLAEWQAIQKVNVHAAEDREVLVMDGTTHSSVTTLGHRWPTVNRYKRGGRVEREWRLSSELRQTEVVPLIAPRSDFPTEPKYDDAFVELVAWYWTEGSTQSNGAWVTITQKRFPERIRRALTALFGSASKFAPNRFGSERDETPRWREVTRADGVVTFFLNREASLSLQAVAPDRIVAHWFIDSLTKAQLDLYIESALVADGNVTERQSYLGQKDRRKAERFQYACIQAGITTSIYETKPDTRWRDSPTMWVVSLRRKTTFRPVNQAPRRERYTGKVWCPTTPNGTWLARRRGTVYFTGNSQMRGADFERYMLRLDEEISLALFTPVLMYRTSDVGSYNLGDVHYRLFLVMLNSIANDMKLHIDRYIIDRVVDVNWGVNAPRARWVPRRLGRDTAETLRAITQAMIAGNLAMPDLEEFSTAVGMEFHRVKQSDMPPTDPMQERQLDIQEEQGQRQADTAIQVAKERTKAQRAAPAGGQRDRVSNNRQPGSSSRPRRVSTHAMTELAAQMFERVVPQIRNGNIVLDLGYEKQLRAMVGAEVAGQFYDTFDAWYNEERATTKTTSQLADDVDRVLRGALEALAE